MDGKQASLADEWDVKFYAENGYWIGPQLLDGKQLEEARAGMDRVYALSFERGREPFDYWKPGDGQGLRKTTNAHWADYALEAVVRNERLLATAAALIGARSLKLFHDQLLYKPGGSVNASNVGWHQDYAYWGFAKKPTMLTAWVALDDVNEGNGCMQAVPRSHTWGLLETGSFFEQDMRKQEVTIHPPEGKTVDPTPLIMKAGQVSFHHALTLHGSGPNNTELPRRSLAVHLMDGDTRYNAEAPHPMGLVQEDGDILEGDLFPILWSAY
jgi:ectoine hydroxylase-related dioxygenase (phytanoyl-CoA dioxygenase family)